MANDTATSNAPQASTKKVSLGNKLAFAAADIFGGGSFNIINFLFTPFLTLVVGIPMVYLGPILLFTKFWDGLIDPFIGSITDGKTPGAKFGKRRWFMLLFAPLVLVGLVLLFFPWNLVTDNVFVKCMLVVIMYICYATAQSFVLIPYYSHASEMTDDFNERNSVNAVRLCFSLASSIVCVALPGMIASPNLNSTSLGYKILLPIIGVEKMEVYGASYSYILMALMFGFVFAVSVLITALFSREQIITPSVKTKVSLKEYLRPLKVKTYRQYLGMQMCNSMGMAIMSSFFFTLCDFYLKRLSYQAVTEGWMGIAADELSRFPIGTIAAALMFVAQIFALPFYLKLIKVKSKRFAYITACAIWILVTFTMIFLPAESGIEIQNGTTVVTTEGAPNWLLIVYGLLLGFGIGGTNIVSQSTLGDVCDVGELYYGQRTEGAFAGLSNFLNTTAQAIGLAIAPMIVAACGYVETQYCTIEQYNSFLANPQLALDTLGMELANFKVTEGNGNVKLLPITQPDSAQIAILLTFTVVPIVIMIIGVIIASRYKLTKKLQNEIVQANAIENKDTEEFKKLREDLLSQL